MTPKNEANKEASQVSKAGPSGMIIRGMTFYKSEPDPMVADDGEPGENCKYRHRLNKVQRYFIDQSTDHSGTYTCCDTGTILKRYVIKSYG